MNRDLLARGEAIWRRLDPLIEDPVGVTLASAWIAEAMQELRALAADPVADAVPDGMVLLEGWRLVPIEGKDDIADRSEELKANYPACPVSLADPLRTSGVAAADMMYRGSPTHRAGFNHGIAWAIYQLCAEPTLPHWLADKAAPQEPTDADKRDAERYRWLRDRTISSMPMVRVQIMHRGHYTLKEGPALDAAIDAAITGKDTP